MYNRYLRDQKGVYTRIVEGKPESSQPTIPIPEKPEGSSRRAEQEIAKNLTSDVTTLLSSTPVLSHNSSMQNHEGQGVENFLNRLLEKVHMEDIDGGDLLLLALLFFLSKEKADEELLMSLGLLLIL